MPPYPSLLSTSKKLDMCFTLLPICEQKVQWHISDSLLCSFIDWLYHGATLMCLKLKPLWIVSGPVLCSSNRKTRQRSWQRLQRFGNRLQSMLEIHACIALSQNLPKLHSLLYQREFKTQKPLSATERSEVGNILIRNVLPPLPL